MHVLASTILSVQSEPASLDAFTGSVESVQFSHVEGVGYTVTSASVMLQGSTSPIIAPVSGAFAAEVIAADLALGSLVGRTVLVLVVNSQPVVLTTIGVGV